MARRPPVVKRHDPGSGLPGVGIEWDFYELGGSDAEPTMRIFYVAGDEHEELAGVVVVHRPRFVEVGLFLPSQGNVFMRHFAFVPRCVVVALREPVAERPVFGATTRIARPTLSEARAAGEDDAYRGVTDSAAVELSQPVPRRRSKRR